MKRFGNTTSIVTILLLGGSLRNDVQGHHDKALSVIGRMKEAAKEFENELVKLKESTQEKSRMGAFSSLKALEKYSGS